MAAAACMAAASGSAALSSQPFAAPRSSLPSPPASSLAFSSRRAFHGMPVRFVAPQTGSLHFTPLPIRATTSTEETSTETTFQTEEIIADLKSKWDAVENKSTVLVYGAGALVALWLSSTIVGAINSVPLLPKIMELVGLGYTGWFVYRYLLFKESRKELVSDIEELKSKITGAGKDE